MDIYNSLRSIPKTILWFSVLIFFFFPQLILNLSFMISSNPVHFLLRFFFWLLSHRMFYMHVYLGFFCPRTLFHLLTNRWIPRHLMLPLSARISVFVPSNIWRRWKKKTSQCFASAASSRFTYSATKQLIDGRKLIN